jgi:hypothetical protein
MQAKTKRRIKRGGIGLAMAIVLGMGVVVYLLQRKPAVWREAQAVLNNATPEMRQKITEDVKKRIAEIVQTKSHALQELSREDEQRAVDPNVIADAALDEFAELTLSNAELVLIINDFYIQWTEQRGYIVPGGVNDPAVIAQNGKLLITFMIQTPNWQQVFSGNISLTFMPDGMAVGNVENLYAGSMPLSMISIGQTLRTIMPASEHHMADRMGDWLAKLEHFEFRPTIELEHRRRARVVAMTVGDDDVTVKMRVQDHSTYRAHNILLGEGKIAVTDVLETKNSWDGSAFVDVPTTTD